MSFPYRDLSARYGLGIGSVAESIGSVLVRHQDVSVRYGLGIGSVSVRYRLDIGVYRLIDFSWVPSGSQEFLGAPSLLVFLDFLGIPRKS